MMENRNCTNTDSLGRNSAEGEEQLHKDETEGPLSQGDVTNDISDIDITTTVPMNLEPAVGHDNKSDKVENDKINTDLHTSTQLNHTVSPMKEEPGSSLILCKVENADVSDAPVCHNDLVKLEEFCMEREKAGPCKHIFENVDSSSRVTLKRRSDSLALISSYDNSSDSDEELTKSAFTELQKPVIIDSSTDTESDSGSIFNLDSDDASNESSQSSGEDNNTDDNKIRKQKLTKGAKPKTPLNCFDLGELPPIKDLQISVKEDECLPFGKVHSIVETLVVIESLPDVPALNLDSVLFTKNGEPLGEVFDVFGPVKRPYYTIRFKSRSDIDDKSLAVGTTVYCAPKTKYTQYVFIHQLARMKGSDASWKNDLEPPPQFLDYSDDEQERVAKKALKEAKAKSKAQLIVDKDSPPIKKSSFEERMNQRNILRNQMYIRNSPPENRQSDWFRNVGGTSNDSPRSSGHAIIRPSQFTPVHFQRQNSPRSPSFYSHSSGRGSLPSSSAIGAFPMRNQLFSNVFQMRGPRPFSSSSNVGVHVFSPNRPPPCISQNDQSYNGNNNLPFPVTSQLFGQQNSLDFQQQPNHFSFQTNQTSFQSRGPQFLKGSQPLLANTNSASSYPNVQSPPFPSTLNHGPFKPNCTMLQPNVPSRPPFHCSRPIQPTSPPSFGSNVSRPFTPNSPPYAPSNSLFSFMPSMPPQRSPFSPNVPFATNSSHMQSFRPFKPK